MRAFTVALLFCFLSTPVLVVASDKQQELHQLWERFAPGIHISLDKKENTYPFHGRILGDSQNFLHSGPYNWAHESTVYELFFADQSKLARSIYSLAISEKDITADIALDRFERGVQGFHYDVVQISHWATKVLHRQMIIPLEEEQEFLRLMLADGVLNIARGEVVPSGKIKHVLGASTGKKRTIEQNLLHERLHVLWDEDEEFQRNNISAWKVLTETEKGEVSKALPGYSKEKELQVIEEWAVRQAEQLPVEQRKKLAGL